MAQAMMTSMATLLVCVFSVHAPMVLHGKASSLPKANVQHKQEGLGHMAPGTAPDHITRQELNRSRGQISYLDLNDKSEKVMQKEMK